MFEPRFPSASWTLHIAVAFCATTSPTPHGEPNETERTEVEGIVRWPDETAASAASVALYHQHDLTTPLLETATDDEGRFRFECSWASALQLVVHAPPRSAPAEAWADVDWYAPPIDTRCGQRELELTLERPVPVSGRVVDDTGKALASFDVELTPFPLGLQVSERAVVTGADGSFVVGLPWDGTWQVTASAPGHGAALEAPLVSGATKPEDVEVVLPRHARASGTIVDPKGEPIADATIFMEETLTGSPRSWGLTESDGRFALDDMQPGSTTFRAEHEDWAGSETVTIDLVAGGRVADIRLTLRVGARVLGRVIDDAGNPLADCPVVLRPITGDPEKDGRWWWGVGEPVSTDADGNFVIEHAAPGTAILTAIPNEGGGSVPLTTQVELVNGEETRVVLEEPVERTVRLSGAIRNVDTKRVSGVVAFAEGGGMPGDAQYATLDDNGGYELELPRAGPYELLLFLDEMDMPDSQLFVDAPMEEELQHDLLVPTGRLAGRVVDTNGEPVEGADVHLRLEGSSGSLLDLHRAFGAATGPDGEFEFVHLVPGRYELVARPPEGSSLGAAALGALEVGEPPPPTSPVEVRLQPSVSVRGSVRNSEGQPIYGAYLFARDEQQRLLQLMSFCYADQDGRFELAGLPAGKLTLFARAPDLAGDDCDPIEIEPGQSAEVELTMGAAAYVWVEVREGDHPVRALVRAFDASGRRVDGCSSPSRNQMLKDNVMSSKLHCIGPLPYGTYTLVAEYEGRQVRQEVEVDGQENVQIQME